MLTVFSRETRAPLCASRCRARAPAPLCAVQPPASGLEKVQRRRGDRTHQGETRARAFTISHFILRSEQRFPGTRDTMAVMRACSIYDSAGHAGARAPAGGRIVPRPGHLRANGCDGRLMASARRRVKTAGGVASFRVRRLTAGALAPPGGFGAPRRRPRPAARALRRSKLRLNLRSTGTMRSHLPR